jgi:tetratricopeptide (TPR) repeat protein
MKKPATFPIALGVCLALALSAFQHARVDAMIEAEGFYRWIVSASQQSDLGWNISEIYIEEELVQLRDEELFDAVLTASESALPETPVLEEDRDEDGAPLPKLIRMVKHNDQSNSENNFDQAIWNFARSSAAADVRRDFHIYRDSNRLASAGTSISLSEIYGKDGVGAQGVNVSLGSMFFGLRKMAANFVWLEVEKYWHSGEIHRMIPLMHLTVNLDPNFIDAYLLGAWHLSYNESVKVEETPEELKTWSDRYQDMMGAKEVLFYQGVDFLQDGIKKNPLNYKLMFDLGFGIYKQKLERYPEAIKYLDRATRVEHDSWVRRQLYICQRLDGRYDDSLRGFEDYMRIFPEFIPGPRFILYNKGSIAEQDAGYALQCAVHFESEAESTADETVRAELLAQATALREQHAMMIEKAEDIWMQVMELLPTDSLAEGHLLMIDAQRDRAAKRYLEAVAKLQQARVATEIWDECNDTIIEIKQEAGIELNYSEKTAVTREIQRRALVGREPVVEESDALPCLCSTDEGCLS